MAIETYQPNHAGEFTGPVINDMDTMIDALNQALGLDQPLPAKQAKALVATATAISRQHNPYPPLDRLEDQHAGLTARLADLLAAQSGGVAATRDTGERLAALATALDEVRRSVDVHLTPLI